MKPFMFLLMASNNHLRGIAEGGECFQSTEGFLEKSLQAPETPYKNFLSKTLQTAVVHRRKLFLVF